MKSRRGLRLWYTGADPGGVGNAWAGGPKPRGTGGGGGTSMNSVRGALAGGGAGRRRLALAGGGAGRRRVAGVAGGGAPSSEETSSSSPR